MMAAISPAKTNCAFAVFFRPGMGMTFVGHGKNTYGDFQSHGGIPKLAGEYFVEHPELTKMNDF
jgi:hypothetical protein